MIHSHVAFVAILTAAACGGGAKPVPDRPVEQETAQPVEEKPLEKPPAETVAAEETPPAEGAPPADSMPAPPPEPPAQPTVFSELRAEDPAKLLYEEIASANVTDGAGSADRAPAYLLRVVVRKDGTWSVEQPTGVKDGNLDKAQKKQFDKALKAAAIKAAPPAGGTCAALPGSTIVVRAKGKTAEYADQCAAEPSKSLAKLTATVHQLVGL